MSSYETKGKLISIMFDLQKLSTHNGFNILNIIH